MSIRMIFALAMLWILSLFVVGSAVNAQVFKMPRPLPEPRIVAGPDFGFRIEGDQNGTPVGTLVVQVDGKWIEAHVGNVPGAPRVSSR